jgi:hypothetical protein
MPSAPLAFNVKYQMAALPSFENIVKVGTFLYDNSVLCDVCISFSPVRFGTGDYEDLPEIADDVAVDTYYVFFGSTTERGSYSAGGGGGYPSLAEAVANVEAQAGFGKTVKWSS